jgi:proteasome alpha subunit
MVSGIYGHNKLRDEKIMFGPAGGGYDRALTTFSPDGRLFQVEYAIEAVKRGTLAIAAKNNEGIVFCCETRELPLQEHIGSEKIFKIDDHVAIAIAGLTSDARTLIDKARVEAQINILSYNSKISVLETTKTLCDEMQLYTQNAGVRPFGIALLIGGIDIDKKKPELYLTDPSGAFWGYKCTAIGRNSQAVKDYLEAEFKPELSLKEIKTLLVKALKTGIEGEITSKSFEMVEILVEKPKFRFLEEKELEAVLKEANK